MNETVTMIFGLIGGLALFLFGMNNMSSSLQKVAGDRMKKVLGFLTRNPLLGAVAGALVTAVLQSSSATTVMVIGFVSAGLMSLPQAISVIFGANIGTTMTALLASIGQSRNAKRTALAHSFFNISGSVVFARQISQRPHHLQRGLYPGLAASDPHYGQAGHLCGPGPGSDPAVPGPAQVPG